MSKIDDLIKFRDFQERKLKEKVLDTLLEDLVGFIFEDDKMREEMNRYSMKIEGLDEKFRKDRLKELEDRIEANRERERDYKTLLRGMGGVFIDSYYDHKIYITTYDLDRFAILKAWIERHKEQD